MRIPNEITVGQKNADVCGSDGRVIQMAVDYLSQRGGGTIKVLPGKYTLKNSIRLKSNIRLLGSGKNTIIRRCPIAVSTLPIDADYGQKEITPKSTKGFTVGMGVILRDKDKPTVMGSQSLTITGIADGKLYVNDYIMHDWCAENGAIVANYFPLIKGYKVDNVLVDGFTVDASIGEVPEALAGYWAAGVHFGMSKNSVIRNIESNNCLGDGICVSTCEHVSVENCDTGYNSEYGIHVGGHSPWSKVLDCHIHHNDSDGLYICWGVRESLIRGNRIHHNGTGKFRNGLSIGHKDTDNIIEENHIYLNVKHGICFRTKTDANGAHRNIIRKNIIENNGSPEKMIPQYLRYLPSNEFIGTGVYINGITHDLVFERNIIRETRPKNKRFQKRAFYLAPGVSRVRMVKNKITGHQDKKTISNCG